MIASVGVTIEGDLRKIMAEHLDDAKRAVTRGIGKASEGLKTELRQQVTGAGMSQRLANTWRAEVYPDRSGAVSLRAAGFVFSRAPDIVDAFNKGVPIRSSRGFYLAVPTPAAGSFGKSRPTPGLAFGDVEKSRKERLTPGGWERRTGIKLRHVWRRGKKTSYLVADDVKINSAGVAVSMKTRIKEKSGRMQRRGATTTVIFWLVPLVRLTKRFDIEGAKQRWSDRLPELIVSSWPDKRA
ncbi:DUF6441 family protein [Ancylobacter moscoviensis]